MAEVTFGQDPDEEDEGIDTVDQIIQGTMPDPVGDALRGRTMTARTALQTLREGRERVMQQSEQDKWLALAGAMLKPTKTGGFGESLGFAAEALGEQRKSARQELADIEKQIAAGEVDLQEAELRQLRGLNMRPVGSPDYYPHPDPKKAAEGHLARGVAVWKPTEGKMELQWLEQEQDGSVPIAVHPSTDPERRAELELLKQLAQGDAERTNQAVQKGIDATRMIKSLQRTLDLIRDVDETTLGMGGWQEILQNVQEWMGIDTEGVTKMGQLRNRLGQAVLAGLKHFPGQISEGERKYMEALEASLANPAGVSIAILEDGIRANEEARRIGIRRARTHNLYEDLIDMDVDPETFADKMARRSGKDSPSSTAPTPGSSRDHPLTVAPGDPKPPAGTWVMLPGRDEPVRVK